MQTIGLLNFKLANFFEGLHLFLLGNPNNNDVQTKGNGKQINNNEMHADNFIYTPKISIITPVWNTDEKWLRLAINSVISQSYENWELCIADGNSTKQHIRPILEEYAKKDARIKVKFLTENKGISGNSNEALSLASGDFVGFLDHDDELSSNALDENITLLNNQKDLDIIYSDNDKIDENCVHSDPFFKPDWSLSMFLSTNYLFHFFICRKSLIEQVGGLRSEFDGAQDYDLILRLLYVIKSEKHIGHIPKILYHWRTIQTSSASGSSAKPYAYNAGRCALQEYLIRNGISGQVCELVPGSYKINYSVEKNFPVGIIALSEKEVIKERENTLNSLINSSTYKISQIFVPNRIQKDYRDIQIIEYQKSYKKLTELLEVATLQYLIFIDIDELDKKNLHSLKPDWIEALLGEFILGNHGVVGTGSPTFGHIAHTVHKTCGPVFCITRELFLTCIHNRNLTGWDFDDLQIFLTESAETFGYENIYTPLFGGNLTTSEKISRYYPNENTFLYFLRSRKTEDDLDQGAASLTLNNSDDADNEKHSNREKLASQYIRGEGIEIGALDHPLVIPKNIKVNYVDRLNNEELLLHYPELKNHRIVTPHIIDDAHTLSTIKDAGYDFCISNHVLEHMNDPISAIMNWMRIIRPGGILFLSIPDASNLLDVGREITSLDHIIRDHEEKKKNADFVHYLECARYWNKISDEDEIYRIATENYKKEYSIHYHTFNEKSIKDLLSYILSINPDLFDIQESKINTTNETVEHIFILEKNTYVKECLKNLDLQNTYNHYPVVQDVIVPVYNAYDEVIRCFYSLTKYQTNYRIILINDCSSDTRINTLFTILKPFESDHLKLLDNVSNLGFVKTVNRGMQFSNSDVILLNSDTIVTEQWAEKIFTCAYQDETIGTVTPFTNNGTICSLPNFCENNVIPEGFTIDGFAGLIDKLSFRRYYEIPTAVGFCMFIRRDLLNKIGFFDDEAFGKGYGEENDFCMRAIYAGYQNILCDDTFIYHKGEASFSETKLELSKKNMQILVQKYPEYLPKVSEFCQTNPIKPFQKFIDTQAKSRRVIVRKKRILYILHHYGGGSEKHVLDLIKSLSSRYVFYIVKVLGHKVEVTEFDNDKKREETFLLSEPIKGTLLSNIEYRKTMQKILLSFEIDLIHIQHLIGHPLDIISLAAELDIPLIYTAHDFYAICPRINLLDETATFCHPYNNNIKCSNCLEKTIKAPSPFIHEWRKQFHLAFDKIQLVIAPSQSVIDILGVYYPNVLNKCQVVEHGHENDLFIRMQHTQISAVHTPFHIAYFGILVPHKGRELFYKLAKLPEFSGIIKWSIFGSSDLHSSPGNYSDANITVYGSYNGYTDLQQIVNKNAVDLVIFPSKCPETFSFTLSEAWALGIPVLVSDIGALNERVLNNGGGWTVDMNDIKSVKNMIQNILKNHEEYLMKKREISNISLKSLTETAEVYSFIYTLTINKAQLRCTGKNNYTVMDISNNQALNSDTIAEKGYQKDLSTYDNFKSQPSLCNRLIRCYKENGLIYTIKRCFTFFYESF